MIAAESFFPQDMPGSSGGGWFRNDGGGGGNGGFKIRLFWHASNEEQWNQDPTFWYIGNTLDKCIGIANEIGKFPLIIRLALVVTLHITRRSLRTFVKRDWLGAELHWFWWRNLCWGGKNMSLR
ncbi:hypothetical protein SLEP1_g7210 [Rubroshorea leprosula]|uniref:Uncharacterized protein n=1 Tax=Rubroshorea leprosula TaxID=152421 RepID=A0AAV5HXY8_9ROSI|nr:hypothetical protein SLEP1_g7210 [Rubroshorea leprosula]